MKLKCGARVVITRNIDVAGGVVSGTIGTVELNLITVRRLKDNELMCITHIKHYVSLHHSTDDAIRYAGRHSYLQEIEERPHRHTGNQ